MLEPVSSAIEANGLRLIVHEWGGEGPPVLLAHPTGFHGRVWAPIAARLVDAGRRVYSFDFRGHGDSDAPDADYSWHGFADDALAVTSHFGVARDPNLLAVGHSKGGTALVLGEHKAPGTYQRIWAYEPVIIPTVDPLPPNADDFLARGARKRRNEFASIEEAFTTYASKPPLDVMTSESLRAYVEYALRDRGDGVFELKCSPAHEAQMYAMAPNTGAFAILPDVQADVLVVCGELSRSVDPALAVKIADRLPHARVEVRPGLGHFGPQQDPAGCVASMLGFAITSGST